MSWNFLHLHNIAFLSDLFICKVNSGLWLITCLSAICTGKSYWWECDLGKKLQRQQENCTRWNQVLFWTVVSAIFFQNCTLIHMITYLSPWLTFTKAVTTMQFKSWTHAISSEPVQFQVNPCNFKWTRAISSEPVQFQIISQSPRTGFVL